MGNFSILNNMAGLYAQNQLNINNANLAHTLLRLSSGKQINFGADDAQGTQIADRKRRVLQLDDLLYIENEPVRSMPRGMFDSKTSSATQMKSLNVSI